MVKRARPDGYPTRPVSGFILFMNTKRPEYVEKLRTEGVQGSIVTHVSRLAKTDWAALGDEGQLEWNGPAAKAIQEYNQQVEEFKKNNPQPVVPKEEKTPKKAKKERPVGTPVKTATSYILFSMNERTSTIAELTEAGIELTFSNIAKKTASKWKLLTPEDRAPWDDKAKDLAAEAKLNAEKELADHIAANPPAESTEDTPVDTPVADATADDAHVKVKRKYVRKPNVDVVETAVVEVVDETESTADKPVVDVQVVDKTPAALADALADAPPVPPEPPKKKRGRKPGA